MKNKILSKNPKYKGLTFTVYDQTVEFEEFETIEFEFIDRVDVAIIIPFKTDNFIIALNQYRAAINDYIIEFPAGKRKENESISDTAIRELKEETGYFTSNLKHIGTFYTAPHFTNEKIFVFIATELTSTQTNLAKKEIIETKEVSLLEMIEYQKKNLLLDSKTSKALTMLTNHRNAKN